MHKKTSNIYRFKYLITGITGPGLKQVYLPEEPPKPEINDFGGRWQRTPLPEDYKSWIDHHKRTGAYMEAHISYIKQQWYYRENGYWFYNTVKGKKTPTYITGTHWFQLQWWKCRIRKNDGFLDFRDPVREIFYYWDLVCEDPKSFGLLLGGPRRMSKSTVMGVVGTEFVTKTKFSLCGITGEKKGKAGSFYDEHILYPFKNLVDFFKPIYDTDTKLKSGISFKESVSKGKGQRDTIANNDALESAIEFGPTKDVNHFNGRRMERALIEEYGKIDECNPASLWTAIKSCFEEEGTIIGKLLSATTADDESDDKNNGISPEFMELVYQSDYDIRLGSGQTKSGLYCALMPAHHVFKYDEFGVPNSEENEKILLSRRPNIQEEPLLYSGEARRNPMSWQEYFYVNADRCQFNVMVLQQRKSELALMPHVRERFDLVWENGIRDTMVIAVPNKNGHFYFSDMPDEKDCNLVKDTHRNGYDRFEPLNTLRYVVGHDPVAFRKTVGRRRSKPVSYGLRKYDESIDGPLTEARAELNSDIKKRYKTGIPHVMYQHRPEDIQIYFENMIKLCFFLGCEFNVELPYGAAIMEYFMIRGYEKFLMNKDKKSMLMNDGSDVMVGTNASQKTTHYMTALLTTWVNTFAHCCDHVELVDDLLIFDPSDTLKHDHTMAFGYAQTGASQIVAGKPKPLDVTKLFRNFEIQGNKTVLRR